MANVHLPGVYGASHEHLAGALAEAKFRASWASTAAWPYGEWSELSWLHSRMAYTQRILSQRIKSLRQHIDQHRPGVVVFYGDGHLTHWRQIIGPGTYARPIADKLIAHERDDIAFFVTRHPAHPDFRPSSDDYFREIGQFLRDKLAGRF